MVNIENFRPMQPRADLTRNLYAVHEWQRVIDDGNIRLCLDGLQHRLFSVMGL